MPARTTSREALVVAIATLLGVGLVGCTPATPTASTAAASTAAVATAAPVTPSNPGASPTRTGLDGPPEATLAAEGGDPVTGQLGTYTWFDSGSDSPWLPGAPMAVGAGEPLTLALLPAGDVDTWMARFVPAAASGPSGAIVLEEGSGDAVFPAPGPGRWTVEVAVVFAAGAGSASYFWRFEVE